jgi:hypothetical protein
MTRSLFAREVARTLKPAVQSCSTSRQNYDFDRVHTGRLTRGRIPAKGCPQGEDEMSRNSQHISVTVQLGRDERGHEGAGPGLERLG